MKTSVLLTAIFGVQTFAFPALLNGNLSAEELSKITKLTEKIASESRKRQAGLNVVNLGFDAKTQKVDISGDHAYVSVPFILSTTRQWLMLSRKHLVLMMSAVPAPV